MFTAYKDAHVVVTGGANGIGKALALGFAKRGANVAVVDIHGDEAKAVAAEITAMGCKSIAIQADVSVLDECAKVYDTVMDAFGRCDVLVNDAGVSALSDVEHIPEKDLRWVFETNVYSHWFMMQKFLPQMRKQGTHCQILNVCSIAGLISMNGAPAYFSSKHAAMAVVREAAIAAFVPEKFYTVDLELTSGCTASSRRIPEKSVAENLLEACRKEMVATIQHITRKEKSENPPPLYDLTTLQRDANRLLGYSAQQTLDYVQSLYEKKLTTYPRTDSCYITDDDEEMLEELTEELEGFLDITPEDVDEAVPRTRRTVNREKVTDHHAILPTRSMLQADLDALPKGEQNVLKLINARTLMAVSKSFRYLETLLTTECAGEEFTAKGKEILEEGWKAVERKVLADILNRKQELTALPNAAENECGILNAELKEGQTSPPKHFTEDLLLHAMETASADSMPEGVERQGIGTPATRAATIEKLVQKGFLERKGSKKTKVLLPTDKGKALITVMPEEIQSPEMTADWETKLLQIERGEMEPSEFMTEINTMITELVKNTEMKKGVNALMKNKIIGICPNCGANVVEREKGWFCENRECRFVLWKDNAFFKRLGKRLDAHVADKLLRDGRVRLKDCKSAKGKTYNATVLLSCEADGRSKFSLEFEGGC